jgi:excisionase family DNA binding protein
MSASDDQSPDKRPSGRPQRERVLQPGILPLARMVAGVLDFAERESPALFEQLGGKPRRAKGDLAGLVAGLGKAIKDRDTDTRLAAAHTLGHVGQVFEVYAGDVATATAAAVSALSAALTDREADVREAVLVGLANFPTTASPALVDRVSRAAEDADPRVRRASIAALRAFGPKTPLAVVGALVRVIASPGAQDDELVKMAIEGLADCGQDAASEAVDTLAVVVRDDRLAADTRVAACKVLGGLGPDAKPASDALAAVVIGAGAKSTTAEVRVAAAQALIRVAELSELASQATTKDQRRDLLSLLRQIGPEATDARRALQAMWEQGPPASGQPPTAPATEQPMSAVVDLAAERLAAVESSLARIEKGLKASQAASPDKQLYTVSEVAELTKLSEWTIRNACSKGRIKAEKSVDGQWRIPRGELVKIQNEGLPK